jgi:hypothetical protein
VLAFLKSEAKLMSKQQDLVGCFQVIFSFLVWILLSGIVLYSFCYYSTIHSTLTCDRDRQTCQLTNSGIIGTRTEVFSVVELKSAEWVGGGDSLPGAILKTAKGDFSMTTDSSADRAVDEINAFIADPDRKSLQVDQSDSWFPFDMLFWILILIAIVVRILPVVAMLIAWSIGTIITVGAGLIILSVEFIFKLLLR